MQLKQAVGCPLLNKPTLDPEDIDSYQAASNIPFLSKVIEQVVGGQLQTFLDEAICLDTFHPRFRPGYGIETTMMTLVGGLGWEMECLSLDSPGHFSSFQYCWTWYPSGLRLWTVIGRHHSIVVLVLPGGQVSEACVRKPLFIFGPSPLVPWGSIVSPVLFNIYVKSTEEIIRRFALGCQQYASDAHHYVTLPADTREAVGALNWCLEAVLEWMTRQKCYWWVQVCKPIKTGLVQIRGDPNRAKIDSARITSIWNTPVSEVPDCFGANQELRNDSVPPTPAHPRLSPSCGSLASCPPPAYTLLCWSWISKYYIIWDQFTCRTV